ncbi:MAG: phospholipase [Frankiaceae bacterium]|jgi:phospholipase C|nr:phospholipase [Frankiaceae bacterium]
MPISRRTFLGTGLAAGALLASGASAAGSRPPRQHLRRLPDPRTCGLDNIVVLCMENRSFDHYLGWLPGADGRQAGLTYLDDAGQPHATHHLTDWQGCGFTDPDHSVEGGRLQLAGGACDGFRKGANDDFALGYYEEADLALLGPLVREFTTFDRYFCSILGPTYPNRLYTHSAATDRLTNTTDVSAMPTIWDRLAAKGVPATYYFSDLPVLALYGERYASAAKPFGQFFAQAASGTLPAYSYLDPFFLGEDQGGSNDDHPHADIRRGQALMSNVVRALTSSPQWSSTALVITYDEWGGFFDHVVPPVLPDGDPDHAQAGFRVPAVVVSPFARRGYVGHEVYDHTSILKMVEWRFGLDPLTARDAAARNLAESFDFAHPRSAPRLPAVLDPGPHLCSDATGMAAEDPFWRELADSPLVRRWGALV